MNKSLSLIVLVVCISWGHLIDAQEPTPSPNFDCPNDDQEGGVYPHPNDCTIYYECANGNAWELHCPDGLYFNPANGFCDFPDNVNCRNTPTTPRPTTPTPTTTGPTTATSTPRPTSSITTEQVITSRRPM